MEFVWVFCGEDSLIPSGIFSEKNKAQEWVETNELSGILTCCPIEESVYQWAIDKGYFKVSNDRHSTPEFIANFSCGYLEHYHCQNGEING